MNLLKRIIILSRRLTRNFPATMKTYRFFRDNRAILHTPAETPMGFKLAGNRSMANGTFEINETELVKKIFPHVDVVINIGANIGYYCCLALQNRKHVVAFEPIWNNLRYLCENVRANDWENRIEIFPIALSDRTGIIDIYGCGTGASLVEGWADVSADYVTLAPTSTLDTVLGSRFHQKDCLILVDVEGSESLVLQGAASVIAQNPKPIWMIEVTVTEHQPGGVVVNPHFHSIFQLFWDHGYEAWTVSDLPRLIEPAEIDAIARHGDNSLLTHNFLFLEIGKREKVLGTK